MTVMHYFRGKKSRWNFYDKSGETILDTASAVQALRLLIKLGSQVPKEMIGPGCWEKEYTVDLKIGGRR